MTAVSLDEIRQLVELQLGKRGVGAEDRLVEDLGAESADIANLVSAAEAKYRISFKESEIARILTAADLFKLVRERL
jgi:acyl carrier protein